MRFHRPLKDEGKWHRWFAWRPVRIGDDVIWWEWIERCGGYIPGDGAVWYYRNVVDGDCK